MSQAPYSLSKAVYHTERIQALQQNKPIPPTNMQIDLEAYCNDNCSFCSYRAEESHNVGMVELLGIDKKKLPMIDDYKPLGKPSKASSLPAEFAELLPKYVHEAQIPSVTFTGGGESTLWPHYDKIIENLVKYGIEIGLITNGSIMTKDRLQMIARHYRWIRFSMDAATEQTHKKTHRTPNSDFERRLEIIRDLVALRDLEHRRPTKQNEGLTIGVSFVITGENMEDIEPACKLFSEIGVDYIRFSFMYIEGTGVGQLTQWQIEQTKAILDECIPKYSRAGFIVTPALYKLDTFTRENDDFSCCYMQRFVWALGADCKVYPCCIQKYIPGWEIGDIRKNTLKEIMELSHSKMTNLDVKECPPCWMRDRNMAMAAAIERPKHANFI